MTLPLSSQCCSFESARRLKELGVPQESLFSWLHSDPRGGDGWYVYLTDYDHMIETPEYSAFTAGELGELLPELIDKGWLELEAKSQLPNGDEEVWGVCYVDSDFERKANGHMGLSDKKMVTPMFYHANEAEARALCLIHLIENDLWNPTTQG